MLLAKVEWGTIPDWLAAFGTLAAFAVALRLLAKELAVRREAEEDRRSEQARLVSTWDTFPEPDPRDSSQSRFFVVVRNASEEPVYSVTVVMEERGSPYIGITGSSDLNIRFFTVAPGASDGLALRQPEHRAGPLTLNTPAALAMGRVHARRWGRVPAVGAPLAAEQIWSLAVRIRRAHQPPVLYTESACCVELQEVSPRPGRTTVALGLRACLGWVRPRGRR